MKTIVFIYENQQYDYKFHINFKKTIKQVNK